MTWDLVFSVESPDHVILLFSTSLCCLFRPVHSALWSVGKVEQAKQRALICWCSSWQFLGRWVFPVQRDVFIVMWFLLLFIQQFKITENQIKPSVNMRKLVNSHAWYPVKNGTWSTPRSSILKRCKVLKCLKLSLIHLEFTFVFEMEEWNSQLWQE